MFPEYRGLITKLKTEDSHFARLFDKHNELDHKVKALESGVEHGGASRSRISRKKNCA